MSDWYKKHCEENELQKRKDKENLNNKVNIELEKFDLIFKKVCDKYPNKLQYKEISIISTAIYNRLLRLN